MKLKVKIDDQIYDVEIGNLSERPITAIVDGESFEVWPESNLPYAASPASQKLRKGAAPDAYKPASSSAATRPVEPVPQPASISSPQADLLKIVKAPIPGVITAILVEPGAEVTVGQELCKLEAMKMNNSIRSSRAGRIASVHITIGQHVKHNDALVEFAG
jgi:biotin carboxyl carrier protein